MKLIYLSFSWCSGTKLMLTFVLFNDAKKSVVCSIIVLIHFIIKFSNNGKKPLMYVNSVCFLFNRKYKSFLTGLRIELFHWQWFSYRNIHIMSCLDNCALIKRRYIVTYLLLENNSSMLFSSTNLIILMPPKSCQNMDEGNEKENSHRRYFIDER